MRQGCRDKVGKDHFHVNLIGSDSEEEGQDDQEKAECRDKIGEDSE